MQYDSKDKYYSMKRSYDRLKKISNDNGNSISNTDPRDATEDFFNQCYHFKDWLKKDTSVAITADIEDFINKSKPLSLCADYCNTFKHAGLDKKSRSGQNLEKINTHIKIDLTPRGFVSSGRLELSIGAQKLDAFILATNCMEEWDEFLEGNQIIFSAP